MGHLVERLQRKRREPACGEKERESKRRKKRKKNEGIKGEKKGGAKKDGRVAISI